MSNVPFVTCPPPPVDYQSLLTREVAELFEGNKMFYSWEPLVAQLVWELQQQRKERTYSP